MSQLKILIASETYYPDLNGAARFTQTLASNLSAKGHQVIVIAPNIGIKDDFEVKKNLKIFRMRSIPLKTIHPYFRAVVPLNINKKVDKIIKDFKPDIIHIQNHFLLGKACLKSAKKNKIPIIGTSHFMPDNLLEYLPYIIIDRSRDLMWRDFVKIYNQLDVITSPTHAAKNLIKKIGIKNKIFVISNGINLDKFRKTKIDDKEYDKLKIDKKIPTFIFIGRLDKDKNIDLILKATSLVLPRKKIQVVIVGKGKDEKIFKKMTKDLRLTENVIFTGAVKDTYLKTLLSLSDVYIGSGSAELQGIAVMEAMAMSLPVLLLNAVALPELLNKELNGYLFELDEQDLADKIIKIIAEKDKIKVMGTQSRIFIQRHSQSKVIHKFESLYLNTINKY